MADVNITPVTPSFMTGFTTGSVIFSSGTALTEDNSNFFWNNTTKSLKVASLMSGTNPAQSGAIRLPYAQYIKSRNNDNTADRSLLGLDTLDAINRIALGDSGAVAVISGAGDANGLLGTAARRWGQLYLSAFVAVGTNPATSGAIRLANATNISWRNTANTADSVSISSPGTNALYINIGPTTIVFDGTNNDIYPNDDNAIQLGASGNRWTAGYFGQALIVGTNPATTGVIRLANNTAVAWRNNANTADVSALQVDTNDSIKLGLSWTADSSGRLLGNAPIAGLGYGTGAGGAVTQATNKATGVTLNKVCGTITLNNASLAADTTVSFTFTNSAIAATDCLYIQHDSVGTLGAYTFATTPAAGSATISVHNCTPGALGEAIVLRFAVIKAVVA